MVEFKKELLVSFIVPIYKVPADVLRRCLMSLDDQDYDAIEVICVLDGADEELRKVVTPFLKKDNFRLLEIEHGGACQARNAGFMVSNGEIVSFFNSDYILKAGAARLWVTALLDNPDCGFAYGGYEYTTAQRFAYGSQPFDPWLLKVANYIDCGFPLWRVNFVPWDPECKSLQDWDFWLRVVGQGTKGFYMGPEATFLAEPPRSGGLSMDSHNNWIDRVHYVKAKNGIHEPEVVVTSVGAPTHGVEIAKMLDYDYRDTTIMKPNAYKGLYLIGWYMKPQDQGNAHPQILMAFDKPGVKKIIHFVGADIFWLRKFPWESLQALSGALRLKADAILCETELAQKELKAFGIDAEIVPIPSYSTWELEERPKEFSVGIFLTERSDFDKYLFEHTLSIVRAMPDVQFHAYGDGGLDIGYPNMKHYKNMPREGWQKFVYETSCLLRLVRHDTLPMSSCEFLMSGRDVVTNIPHPHVEYIDTAGKIELNEWDRFGAGMSPHHWNETKKEIIQRLRAIRRGEKGNVSLPDKIEAREFYLEMLDKKKYAERIQALALGKEVSHANVKE